METDLKTKVRDDWQRGLEVTEMSQEEFDALLEYSTSIPTGKMVGKTWKRYLFVGPEAGSWVKCEYVPDADPNFLQITSKLIYIRD